MQSEWMVSVAESLRARFGEAPHSPLRLSEIAEACGILLVRSAGPDVSAAGWAMRSVAERPVYLESLARPGERIRVRGAVRRAQVRTIVINPNADIPEAEIFWHEFYHLFFSPSGIQQSERFVHHYSTEGALHYREERRANEFAAAVLVPRSHGCETIGEVMERFGVSERIARIAARLYGQSHNQIAMPPVAKAWTA